MGFVTEPCCKCGKPILPGNGKRVNQDARICPDCVKKIDIKNSISDAVAVAVASVLYPSG